MRKFNFGWRSMTDPSGPAFVDSLRAPLAPGSEEGGTPGTRFGRCWGQKRSPQGPAESEGPAPRARERHARALYVNVPLDLALAQSLVLPPLEPDEYAGKAWASLRVDDLDLLESHHGVLGFHRAAWGGTGWMSTVSLLVRYPHGGGRFTKGQLLLSMDFDRGPAGWMRSLKAQSWAKGVRLHRSSFEVQVAHPPLAQGAEAERSGTEEDEAFFDFLHSGAAMRAPMDPGSTYVVEVLARGPGNPALRVQGELLELPEEGAEAGENQIPASAASNAASGTYSATLLTKRFVEFVVCRPTKFLTQAPRQRCIGGGGVEWALFYSSQEGEGAVISAQGCMGLRRVGLEIAEFLASRLGLDPSVVEEAGGAVCFLQPSYVCVDHQIAPVKLLPAPVAKTPCSGGEEELAVPT